jgi:hypothetical protein
VETFILAGLAGLAVWMFRMTQGHFADYLSWPLSIALLGGIFVALGVWRSRRGKRNALTNLMKVRVLL